MNATVFNLELLNPPAEPMPIELGRVLSESQVARRGWRALTDDERTAMASYVAGAREPHVRERRAGLVFMSLASVAPRT
jgi:hypothetical protein